jgi:hypothetical protein
MVESVSYTLVTLYLGLGSYRQIFPSKSAARTIEQEELDPITKLKAQKAAKKAKEVTMGRGRALQHSTNYWWCAKAYVFSYPTSFYHGHYMLLKKPGKPGEKRHCWQTLHPMASHPQSAMWRTPWHMMIILAVPTETPHDP